MLQGGSLNICFPKATVLLQETQAICENQLISSHWFAKHLKQCCIYIFTFTVTYTLTSGVVVAPQMTLTSSSIFLGPQLPSGTWRTQGLSIPWCCLPTSSSVCLVFFPLCKMPCKMVLASLHLCTMVKSSLCDPLPAVSWHRLPHWWHGLCKTTWFLAAYDSTSFPWLVFFFAALLWRPMVRTHTARWMWQESVTVISWNWEKCSYHSKLV